MIAVYDSLINNYVPAAVRDLGAGVDIPAGTHIVPGAGTKRYQIKENYPNRIRIRRSSTYDLNHNTYIKAWGVN
jgi:hypothetical protein